MGGPNEPAGASIRWWERRGGGGKAPKPPRREGAVILSGGRELGIADFGDAEAFPVLWFHGTPGARRQIPPAAITFAEEAGVRVIGVERPGVGWSTPHYYRQLRDWAADVAEVADALEIDRFGVIGLSGGGPYVLACAALLSERVVAGAVLGGVAPSAGGEAPAGGVVKLAKGFEPLLTLFREPMAKALSFTVRNVLSPLADPFTDLYVRFGPQADRDVLARPEMRETLIGDLRNAARHQFKAVIYDIVLFGRHWGFDIADVDVPVYFWHGDADFFVPLKHGEHMADLVPESALYFQPGAGHLATLDGAAEALALILERSEVPPTIETAAT